MPPVFSVIVYVGFLILRLLIAIGDTVIIFFRLSYKQIQGFRLLFINNFLLLRNNAEARIKSFLKRRPKEIEIFRPLEKKRPSQAKKRANVYTWRGIKKQLFSFLSAVSHGFNQIQKSVSDFIQKLAWFLSRPFSFFSRPKKRGRKKKKLPVPFFSRVKYAFLGFLISAVVVFIPLLFIIFIQDLPSPQSLAFNQYPQATKIFDRNGNLLYQIYANQNRTFVPLSSMPKDLQNATIAIEDKNFYKNRGFDLLAILRAARANLSGEPLQGGSTITQQLIKSTLLTPERTISRKVKELVLAVWAERIYSKDQILEMYLNQVPFGGTAWGVQAASEVYFGKNVSDLTLAESAFLAGLPRAPSIYSPYTQEGNNWKKRQKEVLNRMTQLGYISSQEAQKASEEELAFLPPQTPIRAAHFVMYVRELLVDKYGISAVEKGGLRVVTSLDLPLQEKAQAYVKEEVEKNIGLNLTNGAALVTNPQNGDILAMVGSKDYNDPQGGKFNTTTTLRQPGSSIKVVTYAAALSEGKFTAASTIQDSPVTYSTPGGPSYSPVNYDGRFHGNVTLRNALANSYNIPAVKTLATIGVPTMVDYGKKMGITTWADAQNYGLSITLGAAETKMTDMAVAYGTLANSGEKVELNPFIKITDSQGNVLEEKTDIKKEQVLDPSVAFIISDILADNNARSGAFGPNSPLKIDGKKVSVKTGTSDEKRDNWTIGYTPSILVAVWVGNNNNTPMSPRLTSGITGAAPIWNRVISEALATYPTQEVSPPQNIVQKFCKGRMEYFVPGTQDRESCGRAAPISARNPANQP